MVTSKNKSGSKTGAIALLFSSAVMLFTLLFGGVAAADQTGETDNIGIGGANTGVNGAAGNASGVITPNSATSNQTATATGAGDDAVAPSTGSTGNSSTGTADIHTGDANATGNSATNNITQVEGHNGAVVLVDQNATVVNFGVAFANTGINGAVGNASVNVADATQVADATGTAGDAVAANNATVRNNSGGDARITTGDASATGSTSNNTVSQTFDGNFDGLGVVVLLDQNVNVTNVGIGIANTGVNGAIGNVSQNDAGVDQDSEATNVDGDSVASNNGTASNNSTGTAGIITGDANAVGNVATNNVSQIANVNAQGSLGSIVLVDQTAAVNNVGISIANTGLNLAVGNLSSSTSNAVQGAVSGAGPPSAGDSVASNDAIASNDSDGSASIRTGNAEATGNRSTTNLTQVTDVDADGNAIVLNDQVADIFNIGIAVANTGGAIAAGNASGLLFGPNTAGVEQDAESTSTGDDAVAANFASATNNSNGSASITSGNAGATGNASTTNVTQTLNTNAASGFALPDQEVTVVNLGVGIANTGGNIAVGNASANDSTTDQDAVADSSADDAVASNFADATNNSDGSATIVTGNANSIGNDSAATTTIVQTVDTNGVNNVLADQSAGVFDIGIGVSNTGLNAAIGNVSQTTATTGQTATVTTAGGDSVASNFGEALGTSNGSASITTGSANSIGNSSHTTVTQTVDAGDASGFLLTDQIAAQVNFGLGVSNTGVNGAIGNASVNDADLVQTADIPDAGDDDIVAANFGTASITSDGSAEIRTGNANSVGSRSTTALTQTVDHNGSGFALPDQTAFGINIGVGVSNTGINGAVGNASGLLFGDNTAFIDQDATVSGAGGLAGDIVASNDGIANIDSNGRADITTGNANSIGNDAASTLVITQTADSNGAGFTLVDQIAVGINVGIGVSNTGVNGAVGNASSNFTDVSQTALVDAPGGLDADDVVASNNGTTNINSDGSASINTGNADSVGNKATTAITQTSDFNGEGFALVDQIAVDANIGLGFSNTGINLAVGNVSQSDALDFVQDADVTAVGAIDADDVVASNVGTNNIDTNGRASIKTGNATSVGNKSTDHIAQTANTDIDGAGFVLSDQSAFVVNLGAGISNTGVNVAVGNASPVNFTDIAQDADVTSGAAIDAEDVVASNSLNSNTNSDGNASIETGFANAVGNDSGSTTVVSQISDNNISGSGFVLSDQEALVANAGLGLANTGVNLAVGNISQNNVGPVTQTAAVDAVGNLTADDVVAANSATSTQNSDGSASIKTGDAEGVGNRSTTTVEQVSDASIDGAGFMLSDQVGNVINAGAGIGNSGINGAIGNASDNDVDGTQNAGVTSDAAITLEDGVSSNALDIANNSDGRASIETGNAGGYGNISTTEVTETVDADVDGFVDNDQEIGVFNLGLGLGNSGVNLAAGNASQNTQTFEADALIEGVGGLTATDDVVASNAVTAANNSDGSATIDTGDATGYGNTSTTVADGDEAIVVNLGLGLSNTGINLAFGNFSDNDIDSDVEATVTGAPLVLGDDAVASNVITESNDSDGDADITTGDAYALGNRSATGIVHSSEALTINFGLGFANTGINLGVGNVSQNATVHNAVATAPGGIASNVADLSNTSDGSARIRTGNANAFGNIASNATCQGVEFGPLCPQPPLPPLPPQFPCIPGSSNCPNPVPPGGCTTNCGPVVDPKGPKGDVLADTGLNAQTELMLGVLLLAIGALLRRRARTA